MRSVIFLSIRILVLSVALLVFAQPASFQTYNPRLPLHIDILQAPALAFAGGKKYLVYEMHLTDFYPSAPVNLQKIEVLSASNSDLLIEYKDEMLTRNLKHIASNYDPAQAHILDYGRRVVLFLWVPISKNKIVPSEIRHRITLTIGKSDQPRMMLTPPQKVDRRLPLVIEPPLRGSGWLAANGPQPTAVPAHNRLLAPLNGRVGSPQRFATDWEKFGQEDGRLFRNTVSKNEDWYGYNEPVLAVADGVVTEVVDGVPDNTPLEDPTGLTQQTVAGNYIILKIGLYQYAVYGHLKPGSIRFKTGQRVRRGQVLARVGNSGNSTGPHLHFQMVEAPFTVAEGIPFVFSAFKQISLIDQPLDNYEEGAAFKINLTKGKMQYNDLPLNGMVVSF